MSFEFELNEDIESMVSVQSGVMLHHLPLTGMTVGAARAELAERMNVSPDAVSFVDGERVEDETVLAAGQTLCFVRQAGQMG